MKRRSPHIASEALQGLLPGSPCKCSRTLPWCRASAPLNGPEAAAEYTRNLRPWARSRVLTIEEE